MGSTILLRRNDDSPIHVPFDRIDGGWSVRAELREWPDGPVREAWTMGDGSALIERGEIVLLTDRLRGNWTLGELNVLLVDPTGAKTALDPMRVRLR